MIEKDYRYKRLSIGVRSGSRVVNVIDSAKNLSEALTQELDFFKRAKRTPAQINISKEDT